MNLSLNSRLLYTLVAVLILVNGVPLFAHQNPGPCSAYLQGTNGSELERLGGGIIRLTKIHGDGFGDIMNAISLSESIALRWPGVQAPVVIDQPFAYLSVEARFPYFDPHLESNFIGDVEVVRGESPRAKQLLASKGVQILRLPSGTEDFKFVWGSAKLNLYIEEPGSSADKFAYAEDLKRDEVYVRADGTKHLRINPGFGFGSYGVDIPTLEPAESHAPRALLRQQLNAITKLNLPEEVISNRAIWGFMYRHADKGDLGYDYLEGIGEALTRTKEINPVYIFDFSEIKKEKPAKTNFFKKLFGIVGDPSTRLFNHWYADGERVEGALLFGQKSPYTVVHVGPQFHRMVLEFMKNSSLPVLVTGTQSLLEAISYEIPFLYEIVPWKREFVEGMADIAFLNFSSSEARFLVGLLTGDIKCFATEKDVQTIRDVFAQGRVWRWGIDEEARIHFLRELALSSDRQDLFKRFLKRLKTEPGLSANLDRALRQLSQNSHL